MEELARRQRWLQIVEWTIACTVTLAVIFFHASFARHAGGLWRDEVNSVRLAQDTSWQALKADMHFDSFPPLFTILSHAWIALVGLSILHLRALGLLIALVTLSLGWVSVWRAAYKPPLVMLIPFGFFGFSYLFGDGIRPHGFGLLLLVFTAWQACEYLVQGHRWSLWLAAFAGVAAVQTEYVHLIIVTAIAFSGVATLLAEQRRRQALVFAGVVGVIPALSLLTWVWHIRAIASWWYLVSNRQTPETLVSQAVPLVLGAMLILTMSVVIARVVKTRVIMFWSILALGAWVELPIFLNVSAQLIQPHYFLPLLFLGGIAADILIRFRLARLSITIVFAAILLPNILREVSLPISSMPQVAAKIHESATPQDLVLLAPWYVGVGYMWYADPTIPWKTVPTLDNVRIHRFPDEAKSLADPQRLEQLILDISTTLQKGGSVWFVSTLENPHGYSQVPLRELTDPPFPTTYTKQYTLWILRVVRELEEHAQTARLVVPIPELILNSPEPIALLQYRGWR